MDQTDITRNRIWVHLGFYRDKLQFWKPWAVFSWGDHAFGDLVLDVAWKYAAFDAYLCLWGGTCGIGAGAL